MDVSHLCGTRLHVVVDQNEITSKLARLGSEFRICVIKQSGPAAKEYVPLYVGLDLANQLPFRREFLLRLDDLESA